MKKILLLLASVMLYGLAAVAQTGYCTKATDAAGNSTFDWAHAKNFCPIMVSEDVHQSMQAGGIKLDMQVDDVKSHLWIWNGYTARDGSGINSFGGNGGYLDYEVNAGAGWSGFGFINEAGLDVSFMDDSYYLHFGTRGATDTHNVSFGNVMFSIGSGVMDSKPNLGNWKNDGQWYYFDIPVKKLKEMGSFFKSDKFGPTNWADNYFTGLSGGAAGVHIVLENIFVYQKTEGGNTTPVEPTVPVVPEPPFSKKATDAKGASTFDWADAQNFCPILVSNYVMGKMEESGIKLDMQVDDAISHLYIWDKDNATYRSNTADDANSFGDTGGYLDLTVTNFGWSGLGFINDAGLDVSFMDDTYYLHFGTRGKTTPFNVSLGGVAFSVGDGVADGKPNLGKWADDGDWYHFDIPLGYLRKIGNLFQGSANYKDNYLAVLSGGVEGTNTIIENIFIYQKKSLAGEEPNPVDPVDPVVPTEPEEEEVPAPPYVSNAVVAGNNTFDWSNAQNFCPIIVSDDALAKMEKAGIKYDLQVNDETTHLYIWDKGNDTYRSNEVNYTNSFGTEGGIIDFTVISKLGWSGMGIISDVPLNLSAFNDHGYYLHFGVKGKPYTHTITFGGAEFCIGEGTMDGHKNYGTWTDDGQWYYFDVPLALLRQQKKFFSNITAYKDNYFTTLSGGTNGVQLILENVFVYQKKNVGGGGNEGGQAYDGFEYTPNIPEAPARSFKRGVGENSFSSAGELEALADGASWYYNWGNAPKTAEGSTDALEFVPMVWNASGINSALTNYLASHPETKYVLGFNEPNFKSQSNMTPSQAATAWVKVEELATKYGVELVGPALNYTDGPINDGKTYQPNDWMDAFIAAYKAANGGREPRMDYVALHCYMNDHNAMLGFVENFAKRYGKKVWLTEFCAWEGTVSEASQKSSMIQKVQDLEKSDYVYRYAWFKAKGSNSAPFYRLLSGTNLTDMGYAYTYMSTFDNNRYYNADERILATEFVDSKSISIEGSTDSEASAGPAQISTFDTGATLTYNVNVPEANVYTLAFRMSDRAYLNPVKVGVYLDGSNTPIATEELLATGKTATTDRWVTEGMLVNLPAGKHKLQIRSMQSTDCKLQWLSFFHNELTEGIDAVATDAVPVGVAYYNLHGQRVATPATGVTLCKTTFADGSVKVEKIYR